MCLICPDLSGFVWICPDLSGFVRICQDLSGFVRICSGLSEFVLIYHAHTVHAKQVGNPFGILGDLVKFFRGGYWGLSENLGGPLFMLY